ncbi:MAG: type II toxin-antitoxin system prevent-host-death family antitoxin [Verrucomicrobiae bacterium]|nr:type II toxin-antitoxin system prevent-host-death family antitoxin [Verrucomicrobiae bacterium]
MDGIISSHEAKTRFGELLSRVERGEEVIITRREMPVARIIPEGRPSHAELSQLVERVKQRRGERLLNPDGLPRISMRDLVEDGRK